MRFFDIWNGKIRWGIILGGRGENGKAKDIFSA